MDKDIQYQMPLITQKWTLARYYTPFVFDKTENIRKPY
jgi:hypothetical protein